MKYGLWDRYLAIVYGDRVGDEELFLKHTYLATLAKLVALHYLLPSISLSSDEEVRDFLAGDTFLKQDIANFVEEDFFTWFLDNKDQGAGLRGQGLALVRHLLRSLAAYDFSQVSEDTLKGLYEVLVDPPARHDLGEYYTPDWLAHYILQEELKLQEDPRASLLDPACGSGTFLFLAVRLAREALAWWGVDPAEALLHITQNIVGMDVQPLAVTIARTNYLLALGDLLKGARPQVNIPVYLADALRLPEVSTSRPLEGGFPEPVHTIKVGDETFELPDSVVADSAQLDYVFFRIHQYLAAVRQGKAAGREREALDRAAGAFRQVLVSSKPRYALDPLDPFAADVVARTFVTMASLALEGKDDVWPFVLKNAPRAVYYARQGFDYVVGNPPWLSFRYFRSADYARWFRKQALEEYQLLEKGKPHLFTQMELATFFFARAADLYLKRPAEKTSRGRIAFVMPRSIMVAGQHARFTSFFFKGGSLCLKLEKLLDLEGVEPLFRVPACVLVAQVGPETVFPVPCTVFQGQLPSHNASWADAAPRLARREGRLERVQGRLAPVGAAPALAGRSYYADKFYQGATIVPRNFWFVQAPESPLGFSMDKPGLETSEEAARTAKPPWKDVRMRGAVEAHYLYATLPSGDLLPFGYRALRPVVLPLLREGERNRLVTADEALERGDTGLHAWLHAAQAHWERLARKGPGGQPKVASVLDWLDYRRKLTRQRPGARYKVLYNAAGTNLLGCVVDTSAPLPHPVAGGSLPFQGFLAEHKTYLYETDDEAEACYLAGIFNAPCVDEALKPTQTRGLWGERDIEKRAVNLPIPRYNPSDPAHRRLAELSQACHARVQEVTPEIAQRYRSVAQARAAVRELLRAELAEIDALVREMMGT
ncbi:MAG: SAM-dependent DNA methyltransferase [Chloroflexi bacterium]|nr:SAM-dependent DNA methyltransferase [Chloroflexota bacterium]